MPASRSSAQVSVMVPSAPHCASVAGRPCGTWQQPVELLPGAGSVAFGVASPAPALAPHAVHSSSSAAAINGDDAGGPHRPSAARCCCCEREVKAGVAVPQWTGWRRRGRGVGRYPWPPADYYANLHTDTSSKLDWRSKRMASRRCICTQLYRYRSGQ
eukprot:SAG31_NODE_2794_length_5083_cov_2.714687_5_plen_158_part_00